LRPYHEEFQRKASRFRSSSAVPFSEGLAQQSPFHPAVSSFTSGRSNIPPVQDFERFPETAGGASQFASLQVPPSLPISEQKPVVYQQLERHKNYATLHHVAPPKTLPLQRRVSDPDLLKTDMNAPANIAMFNVAKGVKAELEQDPKFRRKAETLDSKSEHSTAPVPTVLSPREPPKQSPSLRHMENFFENVQQFRSALNVKQPPPVPAPKPFNVEHVRSIFHSSSAPKQPTTTTNSASAIDVSKTSQNYSILERAVNSVAQKAQRDLALNEKANEGTQIFRISRRPIGNNVQKNSTNDKKVADRGVMTDTSEQIIQTKPTIFVIGKPVTKKDENNKSTEKTVAAAPVPVTVVNSQDVAVFEKDYSASSTPALRSNQPFPVEESEKCPQQAANFPGILLKNGNSRVPDESLTNNKHKRVAFQCDSGVVDAEVHQTSCEAPLSVVQYDDVIEEPLQRLQKLSAAIGGDLQIVGDKIVALFNEQRNFIWAAAGQKEPPANELQAKLGPIVKLMEEISTFKESKRNTPLFNHISAASEGIQALGWLTVVSVFFLL
uniref:CAP_N domain-containing protein n=1 Tax=Gongylonema pulchrum TaxID=637853 RepID=A0A183ED66_9BILA